LTKNGWTPVSDDFLRYYGELYPQISTGEAMFIIQLLSYKWDEKMPRPGFKTIARRMGISDNQARTYARSLEKNGYLVRVKRVGQTNRFDLTPMFAALEKEAKERAKLQANEEEE
jgi:DNA-binding IclR family transcriptional regulator